MPKKDPTEDALKRLAQLRASSSAPEVRAELATFLAGKSSLIVAKAAEIVASLRCPDLTPQLEAAFDRFMSQADDKGCAAKTAIANTLNHLSTGSERLFLLGIRHVHMEGSYGRPSDAAVSLRSTSAYALASLGSREALPELTDLLMDPEPPCRAAAARALAHIGHESAALPLRVKLLAGDESIEVTEECLAALARLAPRRAVPFIERLLNHKDEEVQSAAALALGSTRDPAALQILLRRFDRTVDPDARKRLLTAIAIARLPEAVAFLVKLIESGSPALALDAISALASYRHDAKVHSTVDSTIKRRADRMLANHFHALFVEGKPIQ